MHTFQGKEAEIVFLVLGTASEQAGSGARAWASGKPNLLNVAITRAKHRLYVISDLSQWSELTHFGELSHNLPTHVFTREKSRPSFRLTPTPRSVFHEAQGRPASAQALAKLPTKTGDNFR